MAENKTRRNIAKHTEELVITRIFDAPRELVWKAWKDPELMKRWWGRKTLRRPLSRSISALGANTCIACDRRRDKIFGALASIAK